MTDQGAGGVIESVRPGSLAARAGIVAGARLMAVTSGAPLVTGDSGIDGAGPGVYASGQGLGVGESLIA